ncbi:MAG: nicotinate (nicotinamide) nucleotide adenylyltransferase [bacterium]
MRTILYFGSFNPIHNGHIALANYLLSQSLFDRVMMVLSPQNPLKVNSDLWDDNVRLDLARKAVEEYPNIEVTDIEFSLPTPNYTAKTLRIFRENHPDAQFALLIGEDNYNIFDKWYNYEEILMHHKVFVYPRNNETKNDKKDSSNSDINDELQSKFQWLNGAPLLPISSTEVRTLLAAKKSISHLVPRSIIPQIESYILSDKI